MAHSRSRIVCLGVALFLASLFCRSALADAVPARVASAASDHSSTVLEQQNGTQRWVLSGPEVLQSAGRYLDEGDLVSVTGDPKTAGGNIAVRTVAVGGEQAVVALIVSGLILLTIAGYAGSWSPSRFLVGADNRVSNSKCQVVLWFGVAMTTYLALLAERFIASDGQFLGGIAIPANVLAMTGLSGLTFAGAKMIAVTKNNNAPPAPPAPAPAPPPAPPPNGAAQQAVIPAKRKAPDGPSWRNDLFTNDQGELDFGDFQMILIVWIAVLIYLGSAYMSLVSVPLLAHVSLPDVDTSLLAAFGVGQGAYLAKKAALPVGTG